MKIVGNILITIDKEDIINNCVVIPQNVEILEKNCFKNQTKIEKIFFPSNLKHIGNNCFENCIHLEKAFIPQTVLSIGDSAFKNCSALKTVELPYQLDRINANTFLNCHRLSKISIPSNVIQLGMNAFHGCTNIREIFLSDNVKIIGASCFQSSGLEHVMLSKKLEKIELNAFRNCQYLKEISMPNSVIEIGANSFKDCHSLKNIVLSNKIKIIPQNTFYNCVSLNELQLPKSIEKVEHDAISNCVNLKSITAPRGFDGFEYQQNDSWSRNILLHESNVKVILFKVPKKCPDGVISFFQVKQIINDISFTNFLNISKTEILNLQEVGKYFSSVNLLLNYNFLKDIAKSKNYSYVENLNLKHFKGLIKVYPKLINPLNELPKYEIGFYKFLFNIGVFSKETTIVDGKTIEIAQIATNLIDTLIKHNCFNVSAIAQNSEDMHYIDKPSAKFLKYISQVQFVNGARTYPNWNYIMNLPKYLQTNNVVPETETVLALVIENFEKIITLKLKNENGFVISKPTVQAQINQFIHNHAPYSIKCDNPKLAFECAKFTYSEQEYIEANQILTYAKETNSIENILSTHLIDNKKTQFKFEWLPKNDIKNITMGYYTDCCTVSNLDGYGQDIVINTVVDPNYQNMVIYDENNELIAKATLYINPDNGYGIFNQISVNSKYAKNSIGDYVVGYANNRYTKFREEIFETFMRGTKKFVETYNNENPNKQLNLITIGISRNNKFSNMIKHFCKTSDLKIYPPECFQDAELEQCIVLEKERTYNSKTELQKLNDIEFIN